MNVKMNRQILLALMLLLMMFFGNGCVTRTITRTPTIGDYQSPAARRKINEQGMIVEKKTLWFWQL
jgi:hypothetical protein